MLQIHTAHTSSSCYDVIAETLRLRISSVYSHCLYTMYLALQHVHEQKRRNLTPIGIVVFRGPIFKRIVIANFIQ